MRDFGSLRAHRHEKLYTDTFGSKQARSHMAKHGTFSGGQGVKLKQASATFSGNAAGADGAPPAGLFVLKCRDQNEVSPGHMARMGAYHFIGM